MARGFLGGFFWGGICALGAAGAASVVTPILPIPEVSSVNAAQAPVNAPPQTDQGPADQRAKDQGPTDQDETLPGAAPELNEQSKESEASSGAEIGDAPDIGPDLAQEAPQLAEASAEPGSEGAVPIGRDADLIGQAPLDLAQDDLAIEQSSVAVLPEDVRNAPPQLLVEDEVNGALAVAPIAEDAPSIEIAAAARNEERESEDRSAPRSVPLVAVPAEPNEPIAPAEPIEPAEPTEPRVDLLTQAGPEDTSETNAKANLEQEPDAPEEGGGEGALEAALAEQNETPSADGAQIENDIPALERFSVAAQLPDENPLMSIVLIDEGAAPDLDALYWDLLEAFPQPLTIAIDPAREDAAERMARYRSFGFEVLALTDGQIGSAPQTAEDWEAQLAQIMQALPEPVGVLEAEAGALQPDRARSEALIAALPGPGLGLLLHPQGENIAQKTAVQNGVAAATLFRDFDSAGQSASVIRRFLDQAARRARLQDGVVMLGRIREETLAALALWSLQDRAQSVTLAPISAVLKMRRDQAQQ